MRTNNHFSQSLISLILVSFLLSNVYGCKENRSKRLSISVPCSIFAAFCEILDEYKKEYPDVKINFDTGNTIVLMRKVLYKGARPDIYIGTGPSEIEPLIEKGLVIPETKTTITFDSVILATPPSNPKNIHKPSDLLRPDVRSIAIPDPATNSSGKYAVEALKKLKLWDALKDKVTFTEFGRHTRNYIMKNKIDAGIIYKSCLYEDLKSYDEVLIPKEIFVVADILKETQDRIPTSICILKTSKNRGPAQDFLNYMTSVEAKAIFKKWEGKEIKNL